MATMFAARFFSTVLLVGFLVLMVWARWYWAAYALMAVTGLLAQAEFYRLQQGKELEVYGKFGLLCGGLYYLVTAASFWVPGGTRLAGLWETAALVCILLAVIGRSVFFQTCKTPVSTLALTLFGFFYVPFLYNFLAKIIFLSGCPPRVGVILAFYTVLVSKMADMGAYVVGTRFGRHPMTPQISPRKTWEGFAGGMVLALATSLLAVGIFPESLAAVRGAHAWILGLLLPLASVLGDLSESVIKRDAHIKDSGGVIPGIGGCLDLIDSLLFTAPLFFLYHQLFLAIPPS